MLKISSGNARSRAAQFPSGKKNTVRRVVLVVACALIPLVIAGGVWGVMHYNAHKRSIIRLDISHPPPPLPGPLNEAFMPIDAEKAQQVNTGIPVSAAPLEVARPFLLQATVADIVSQHSAVDCLTAAVYYEAASESDQGQRAVAQVVLNRVRHPAFPKSVCGVVYQGAERRTGCQFSFACDGSLARKPSQSGWSRARLIALAALAGVVEPSVGTATHYHANFVVPYWAWSLDKITTVGAHIFYRWKGYWGRRAAFTGVYAGETSRDESATMIPDGPVDLSVFGMQSSPTDLGPRPLADDIGHLPSVPGSVATPTVQPRADQEYGTLVADENTGTPTGSGPKGD